MQTAQPSRARIAGRFAFNLIVAPLCAAAAFVGIVMVLRAAGAI
ncbi:MAG TPA: hypothetical protein VIU82_21855 [Bosea sp. (in: a-proteobacteria)]